MQTQRAFYPFESYRCSRCGIESTIKEAFVIKPRLFGKAAKITCFECASRRAIVQEGVLLLFAIMMGWLVSRFVPISKLSTAYLALCINLVLTFPLIIFHELAHALMGLLLGFRVFAIYIGAGKPIYTTRIGDIKWLFCPFPISGATVVAGTELPFYRVRKLLIILAGPGVHALFALLLWKILPDLKISLTDPLVFLIAKLGFWMNLSLLVFNLYPHKTAGSVGVSGTDGWGIFSLFFTTPQELKNTHVAYYILAANAALELNDYGTAGQWVNKGLELYPNELGLINVAGVIYMRMNKFEKGRDAFLRILAEKENVSEITKYIAMNNVAFANIMLDDPALLPDADNYSVLAYKNIPWEPAIQGTRGAVLISLGQVDEGIELLKKTLARSVNKNHKATDACLIARAESRRGNFAEAHKYLSAAKQFDPQCTLLTRVENELARAKLYANS